MEFKRLSDVEVVAEPTESANVLIEENGVIKKAPKTAVGGSSEWDAVFIIDDIYEAASTISLSSGSFDAIKAKVEVNDLPKILIVAHYEYGDVYTTCTEPCETRFNHTDSNITIYFYNNWNTRNYFLFNSDNTIAWESDS